MDGLVAVKRLREVEARDGAARQRMPVIACTGNARQEQVDKCLAAGFDAVVVRRRHDCEADRLRSSRIGSISSSRSSRRRCIRVASDDWCVSARCVGLSCFCAHRFCLVRAEAIGASGRRRIRSAADTRSAQKPAACLVFAGLRQRTSVRRHADCYRLRSMPAAKTGPSRCSAQLTLAYRSRAVEDCVQRASSSLAW